MITLGLVGANGKMGQAISSKLQACSDEYTILKYARNDSTLSLSKFCQKSDVIIDFSSQAFFKELLKYAVKNSTPLVSGTTGLTANDFDHLEKAAKHIAIVYSANMSIGANLIALLSQKMSQTLGSNYDTEIIESHHRYKKDTPSGTALMLAKTISQVKNLDLHECTILDRHTKNEPRHPNQIGIASIRGGGIYGEHEVLFAGDNEVISIKHQALNRECFVDGAIKAVKWIINKKPGLFSLLDVLEEIFT